MHRLIFFDIDGTLAYPGQQPPLSAIAAIQRARQNGHMAFISTGRTMDSIPLPISAIGFDGGIFSSGAVIAVDNHIVMQHFMNASVVQEVLSTLHRHALLYTLETADGRFNSENGDHLWARIDFSNISKEMRDLTTSILFDPTAIPLSHYAGQPIHKIAYYSTDLHIAKQLNSKLQSTAKIVPFNNLPDLPLATGEISDYSVNKGCALRDICHYFHIPPSDCIAFGDSMNDSEILDMAGIGIAMGNADPELKACADMVCDRCEHDGIAKALHALELI